MGRRRKKYAHREATYKFLTELILFPLKLLIWITKFFKKKIIFRAPNLRAPYQKW